MKLKFKNQDFQTDAVNAICNPFAEQEKNFVTFSILINGLGGVFRLVNNL